VLAALLVLLAACRTVGVNPSLVVAGTSGTYVQVYEALERLIQLQQATERDREYAYDVLQEGDDGTPRYAFVRAAVAGRLAQERGLTALGLIKEAEAWVRKSVARDPEFERGAARRMLGTLYVLAGSHSEHGDSEEGLELLEQLAAQYPGDAVNHLRVGEAYVALGDAEGGYASLCRAQADRESLTPEEARLLERLIADAGGEAAIGCDGD
jgi:tetratricopeptide (TPR) repeat protein